METSRSHDGGERSRNPSKDLRRVSGEKLFLFLFLVYKSQRHLLLPRVEQGDLEVIGLAEFELRAEFVLAAEFADVHQAGDTFLNRGEGTVSVELDDYAAHDIVLLILL